MRKRTARGVFTCQGEPASEPVRSRFQKSLHDTFLEAASAAGVSPSEYVRLAVREKIARDRAVVSE